MGVVRVPGSSSSTQLDLAESVRPLGLPSPPTVDLLLVEGPSLFQRWLMLLKKEYVAAAVGFYLRRDVVDNEMMVHVRRHFRRLTIVHQKCTFHHHQLLPLLNECSAVAGVVVDVKGGAGFAVMKRLSIDHQLYEPKIDLNGG